MLVELSIANTTVAAVWVSSSVYQSYSKACINIEHLLHVVVGLRRDCLEVTFKYAPRGCK